MTQGREWEPQVVSLTLPIGSALVVEPAEAEKATGRGRPLPLIRHQARIETHWCPEAISHRGWVLTSRIAVKKDREFARLAWLRG